MYLEYNNLSPHLPVKTLWYADSGESSKDYMVTPELTPNLIFKLLPDHTEVILTGASTQLQTFAYVPDAHYFGIRFQIGYVPAVCDANLHDLLNTSLLVSPPILNQWNELHQRLRDCSTIDAQFSMLIHSVKTHMVDKHDKPTIIQEALHTIRQKRGVISIQDLSRRLLTSDRHLERLFRKHVGVSPKFVCRTVRIQYILERCWQTPAKLDLTDLTLQLGYTDQAHLANDFRKIMGMSITEYIRQTST